MKKIVLLGLCILFLSSFVSAEWVTIFYDDFTSELDPSVWNLYPRGGNINLQNNHLVLSAPHGAVFPRVDNNFVIPQSNRIRVTLAMGYETVEANGAGFLFFGACGEVIGNVWQDIGANNRLFYQTVPGGGFGHNNNHQRELGRNNRGWYAYFFGRDHSNYYMNHFHGTFWSDQYTKTYADCSAPSINPYILFGSPQGSSSNSHNFAWPTIRYDWIHIECYNTTEVIDGWDNNCDGFVDNIPIGISATGASIDWFDIPRTAQVVQTGTGSNGLQHIRYRWRDAGQGPTSNQDWYDRCSSGWGTATSNGAILNAPEGDKVLYLCARDNAGNAVTWSGTYRWQSDVCYDPLTSEPVSFEETIGLSTANLTSYRSFDNNFQDSIFPATTASSSVLSSLGKFSNAAYFNGVNSNMQLGPSSKFNFGNDDFSICLWINSEVQSNVQQLFVKRLHLGASVEIQITPSGIIEFHLRSLGGLNTWVHSQSQIQDNTWHHICGVRRNGVAEIFFDGVLESSAPAPFLITSTAEAYLGYDNVANSEFYQGYIDDFVVLKRALSDCQIKQLALGPTACLPVCEEDLTCAEAFHSLGAFSIDISNDITITSQGERDYYLEQFDSYCSDIGPGWSMISIDNEELYNAVLRYMNTEGITRLVVNNEPHEPFIFDRKSPTDNTWPEYDKFIVLRDDGYFSDGPHFHSFNHSLCMKTDFDYSPCFIDDFLPCIASDGTVVPHGESLTYYFSPSVGYGNQCVPQSTMCFNGEFQDDYEYLSCFVRNPIIFCEAEPLDIGSWYNYKLFDVTDGSLNLIAALDNSEQLVFSSEGEANGVYMCEVTSCNQDGCSHPAREVISLRQDTTYIPYGVLDVEVTELGRFQGRNQIPYAQTFSYSDEFSYNVLVQCLYGDCGILDSNIVYGLAYLSPTFIFDNGFVFTQLQGASKFRINIMNRFSSTLLSEIFTEKIEVYSVQTEEYAILGDGFVPRLQDVSCVLTPDITVVYKNGTSIQASDNYLVINDSVQHLWVNGTVFIYDTLRFEPALPISTAEVLVSSDLDTCGESTNCLLPGTGNILVSLVDQSIVEDCGSLFTSVDVTFDSICPDSISLTNITLDWTRFSSSEMQIIAEKNGHSYIINPEILELTINADPLVSEITSSGIVLTGGPFVPQPESQSVTVTSNLCTNLEGTGTVYFTEDICTYWLDGPAIRNHFWKDFDSTFGRIQVYELCPGDSEPSLVDLSNISLDYESGNADIIFLDGSGQSCSNNPSSNPSACYVIQGPGGSTYNISVNGEPTGISIDIAALCPYFGGLVIDDERYSGIPLDEFGIYTNNSFTVENIFARCHPDVADCRFNYNYLSIDANNQGLIYSVMSNQVDVLVNQCQISNTTTRTDFEYDATIDAFCIAPLQAEKTAQLPREHRRYTLCSYNEPAVTRIYLENHILHELQEGTHEISNLEEFIIQVQRILESPNVINEFRSLNLPNYKEEHSFVSGSLTREYITFGRYKQENVRRNIDRNTGLSQIPSAISSLVNTECDGDIACRDVVLSILIDPGFYVKATSGGSDPDVVYCYVDEDITDSACCSTRNSCVYEGVCYPEGTLINIDKDGIWEFCDYERITMIEVPR